jgi:hypothetical protein
MRTFSTSPRTTSDFGESTLRLSTIGETVPDGTRRASNLPSPSVNTLSEERLEPALRNATLAPTTGLFRLLTEPLTTEPLSMRRRTSPTVSPGKRKSSTASVVASSSVNAVRA